MKKKDPTSIFLSFLEESLLESATVMNESTLQQKNNPKMNVKTDADGIVS